MTEKMTSVDIIFLVILIIGGINWGLVGLLEFDLVAKIFGSMSILSRFIYILVGISAIYLAGTAAIKKGAARV